MSEHPRQPPASSPFIRIVVTGDRAQVDGQAACAHDPYSGTVPFNPGGTFVKWYWDGVSLTVETDRLGFYPLFYARGPRSIVVSPSLLGLLAAGASTELDDTALATFFRLGFFLGEDTPFKAVRMLPPGGHLTWSAASFKVTGTYRIPRMQPLRREAAMDLYAECLRAAVRATCSEAAALPLSGGRDSRHLLLTLADLGQPPRLCLTVRHYPPRADEDALVAARLTARLGISHVVLPQRQRRLLAEQRKNVATHFGSLEHAWILSLADYLAAHHPGILLYDGIGGDVLSAGLFLDEQRLRLFEGGQLEVLADLLLGDDAYVTNLLPRSSLTRMPRESARNRLTEELSRHVGAPNPVGSFFFWNRTRRSIALSPFSILHPICRIATPYLDQQVYELLTSLPASLMLDHRFHTDTIARAFPRFADIPYERKDVPDAAGGAAYRAFAFDLLRHRLRTGPVGLVRPAFGIGRTLRCLFDPRYAPGVMSFGPLVAYAMQLGSLHQTPSTPIGAG